ncbi:MAG: DNA internalization-related competence protein ComEC/Rec2 [Methyloglobulus sp.]|nr:DNA internalization-related competence protein ComEC/Rec2 [Methyloglobulus sp.]
MVSLALTFLVGILWVQQLAVLPQPIWFVVVFIGLCVLASLRWWRLVFFVAGVLWALLFASLRLNNQLPAQLEGRDIDVQGIIADLPEYDGNHVRFNFKVSKSAQSVPYMLRLSWYYPDQPVKAGQNWAFTVRLKHPHGNFNPGGFDYERWLFVEGIGATGYVRPKPQPIVSAKASGFSFLTWRQDIVDRLEQTLSTSARLPLIKALTIGDGNSLTPQQWEVFRKTGTTHLMVISGSHIGLIAGLAYLLVIRFWAWLGVLAWSPQKAAAILALVVAAFYAGLTGFSVPAQRSALMIAIAMIAIVQQRNTHPCHILAVALFAVLLVDPLVVLSAGFWLSFIAVSLIIYALAGRLSKPGFWRDSLKINWVTSIGLAPLLLFFFQQVSVIAPLANLIAVPIISLVVVPLALLATLVLFFAPIIATKLFFLVDLALQGLWWVLIKLAELPLATVTHSQPSWWALGFAVPGLLLLLAPKGMPSRWLGIVMLLPLLISRSDPIKPGVIQLTLLDVGQGLSAVVQTANHVLVYDTGAKFSSTSDSGQSVLVPFLKSQGIDKVDSLLVSHGDNDHIGGTDSLIAAIETEKLLTSVPQQLSEHSPTLCTAGQSWEWDKVKFSILSPKPTNLASDNDNSCVLLIQSQQGNALLPGDIEADAESWLVKTYGVALKADVLIAPHHGSQTSSTTEFLHAVQPSIILIPAGYRNQFGHPHEKVLARYRDFYVNTFDSAGDGAIKISIDTSLKAESWRTTQGRYWNYKK